MEDEGHLDRAVLVRFGMLAYMSAMTIGLAIQNQLSTWDLSAWYAGRSLVLLALIAVLVVYTFRVSLAGRPLLETDLFDGG